MLSWLARSFCFFLLVASSKPRDTLLWPGALVLLDIFSRLEDTNGPPGSVMESGSGVRRFLPGPAILATLCGQTLWQGTSGLNRRENEHGRRRRPNSIRIHSLPQCWALPGPVPSHDLHCGACGKPHTVLSEETYLITAVTMLTAKTKGLSELPRYNRGSSICGTH